MNSNTLIHNNNFGFIRLLLSSFVIISHSFPLTGTVEPIDVLVNGQFDLGKLALNCFFVLSGYLITQSIYRSSSILGYLWKRIIRIFPGLIVALLFTIIVLYITDSTIIYNPEFYTYLPRGLSLYNIQYQIDGVFENNPYPKTINGSLWSLRYEFTLYLLFTFILLIKKHKKICLIFILLGIVFSYVSYNFRYDIIAGALKFLSSLSGDIFRLSLYFLLGSFFTFIDLNKINTKSVRCLLLILVVLTIYFNVYNLIGFFFISLLMIMIGHLSTPVINAVDNKLGDLSYGLYIYGWFIQQIIMHYHPMNSYSLMVTSWLITAIIAYFSWHYVEKKVLNFKNLVK